MSKLAEQASKFNESQPGPEPSQAMVHLDDPMEALLSPTKVAQIEKIAKIYSSSRLVPREFRGDYPSTFVAMQLAARMKVDPFMLMQNMYVVHGRPGLNAKLIVALFNSRDHRFRDGIKFDIKRDGKGGIVSCTAWSVRSSDGQRVDGPVIHRNLVAAEGWDKPKRLRDGSGYITSKWVTMPEMMYRYRAASWFVNQNAPEVILGMPTVEELEDIPEPSEVEVTLVEEPKPEPSVNSDIPDTEDLRRPEPDPKPEKESEKAPAPPPPVKDPEEIPVVDSADDPHPGITLGTLFERMDMVGMPTSEWEKACSQLGLVFNDKRTHTPQRLRKLDGYIQAFADSKNRG